MADYDMDPDAMTLIINRLRAAGEDFGSAWEMRRQTLQAGQVAVGRDQLAKAFLERYLPIAENIRARADGIPTAYGGLCDDAMGCVADYRSADAQGTGAVNRMTGADGRETPA